MKYMYVAIVCMMLVACGRDEDRFVKYPTAAECETAKYSQADYCQALKIAKGVVR